MCTIQESHKISFLIVNTSQSRYLNSNLNSHLNLNSVDESCCPSVERLFVQSCSRPSTWCMHSGLVPDWPQDTVYICNDLLCTHEIDYMFRIDMIIGVIHHMQAYISRWLDAGVWYPQCIYYGDAAGLH